MEAAPTPNPVVLVICGPAGSGKTTLCDRLLEEFSRQVQRLVTTTSRQPRPGEVDGIHYHFLSPVEFEQRIAAGAFIEWAKVHGRYYGSQRAHLEALLEKGVDILLNIDIQGAAAFHREAASNRRLQGRLHRVFIKPESMDQLRERLKGRGADDDIEIERRMVTAREEIAVADTFEHIIISGTKAADYRALRELYLRLKRNPME